MLILAFKIIELKGAIGFDRLWAKAEGQREGKLKEMAMANCEESIAMVIVSSPSHVMILRTIQFWNMSGMETMDIGNNTRQLFVLP
jgi:hypothetical protein